MLSNGLRRAERIVRRNAQRSALTWRYGVNLGPTLAYRRAGDPAAGEAGRVVDDLFRDGISLTSVDALVGPAAGADLFEAADRARHERSPEIAAARAMLSDPTAGTQKPYLVPLLGADPPLEAESAFGRFALQPRILEVVHAYFRMYVRLRYYNIWQNLVTTEPAHQSQLWHRDPEDRIVLKLFVALEDVDEGCGPFTYAPGTHTEGTARSRPAHLHHDGPTPRSSDDQMAAVVPRDRWIRATGPRGTIFLADTRGYHRGGRALVHDRVLFVCQYLSRAAGRDGLPTRGHDGPVREWIDRRLQLTRRGPAERRLGRLPPGAQRLVPARA